MPTLTIDLRGSSDPIDDMKAIQKNTSRCHQLKRLILKAIVRIEALNELIECLTEGNQVDADEGLINILCQIMGVFIYEAKQIMTGDFKP